MGTQILSTSLCPCSMWQACDPDQILFLLVKSLTMGIVLGVTFKPIIREGHSRTSLLGLQADINQSADEFEAQLRKSRQDMEVLHLPKAISCTTCTLSNDP